MPANNEPDILGKLQRLLAVTPEHALSVPPISRRMLAAAVSEIACLRTRVAELQVISSDLAAIIAAPHIKQDAAQDGEGRQP